MIEGTAFHTKLTIEKSFWFIQVNRNRIVFTTLWLILNQSEYQTEQNINGWTGIEMIYLRVLGCIGLSNAQRNFFGILLIQTKFWL